MARWSVGAVLSLLAVAAAVAAAAAEGPAPAPSVEESSGYQNYRHQILKRGGLKAKNILLYDDIAKAHQNPRPGVIISPEGNTEPPLHGSDPVAAPSAEEEVTRWAVLVAGSSGYRLQADVCHAYHILKRGGPEEIVMVCLYDDIAKAHQSTRRGVIVREQGNTEPPLIVLVTQDEHDAAPAPAPSVEGSSGNEKYRHQAYQILLLTQDEHDGAPAPAPAPAPSVEDDSLGDENYHHQILKRGGLKEGVTGWAVLVAGSSGYKNYGHQAADECHAYQILKRGGTNNEESILLCMDDTIAKNSQDPRVPSAEEGATTKRAELVAGSYDRRQATKTRAEKVADHSDGFDMKGLTIAGCLVVGGALLALVIVFLYRVYRFFTLEIVLRRRNLPFGLYPPKGAAYQAGDVHTICMVCLSRFTWCARIAVLPACGHIFHRRCLRVLAAQESPRCPMCRAAVA
ncbi:uncharacterized protein [Lolium perenne]|uniref:uncharacterized protein n=1 Tax=Lolium perenne TaxID=4522 RepID=UPI0021F539E9|nr:uncharacterized protein LOC127327330 [Lolium perenne]